MRDPVFKIVTPCLECRHKDYGAPTCAAFPSGIPKQILLGILDHTKPVKGDSGIIKQPIPVHREGLHLTASIDQRLRRGKLRPTGILWLDADGVIGFHPLDASDEEVINFWKRQLSIAYKGKTEPNPSAADAFSYWSEMGNGITWQMSEPRWFSSLQEVLVYLKSIP